MANKMFKKEMENKLRRLLLILINGTREEFKKAKKEIETLWHHETETFKSGAHIALEFLPKFNQIENIANKEAFASGLSFFFLTLADDHFETLKDFTLDVIQHPDGHVREAIRKTADWLFCSLTSRADPFVYPESKELTDKQRAEQIKGREEYLNYVKEIEALIDKYENEDEDVEYINEMKPSINKSLQQLWNRLTECRVHQKILEATSPIPYEIFIKRKEIEQELMEMLKETGSDFSLQDVKDAIFHEEDSDDMMKVVAMFDRGGDASELSNILELVSNAWNYFPHKSLNGFCPTEKILEFQLSKKSKN